MPANGEWMGELATSDTVLRISGFGKLLYQARGLTQTLEPIAAAQQLERTINGTLVDVSNPIFRKYRSKISVGDIDAPPFDNLWPGMLVTVECAAALCFATGNPGSPARTPVAGAIWIKGAFTFYRPILTMLIVQPNNSFEEWKHDQSWDLELEEQ